MFNIFDLLLDHTMDLIIWILIGLLILGGLLAFFNYRKNKNLRTNYKTMFIIGITWIPLGIATENYTFMVVGIVFMIIGLNKKKSWKENSVKWSELTSAGRKVRFILIASALLLLFTGLFIYYKSTV